MNVFCCSPPLLEVTHREHLLPSTCRLHIYHLDEDPDDVDSTTKSESEESFSSVDIEEEAGAGGGTQPWGRLRIKSP